MARFSKAYSDLIVRLHEIDAILSMSTQLQISRPITRNFNLSNTLYRSGILLLCSHLEAYVEDLACLAIANIAQRSIQKSAMSLAFRYHLSSDLITPIRDANDPEVIAKHIVALFCRDGHIWDNSSTFARRLSGDKFIRGFSGPSHKRVSRFFGRFGYREFGRDLARVLPGHVQLCIAMVDHLVDQRNKIAHGDLHSYGTPADLRGIYSLVKLYCRHTDIIVGDWFRGKGCAIR